jgi:hypothetical protein
MIGYSNFSDDNDGSRRTPSPDAYQQSQNRHPSSTGKITDFIWTPSDLKMLNDLEITTTSNTTLDGE